MFSNFFFQNKLSVADADLYLRSDHSEYIREVLKDTPWGAPCDNCLKDKDLRIPKEPFLLYTYVLNFMFYVLLFFLLNLFYFCELLIFYRISWSCFYSLIFSSADIFFIFFFFFRVIIFFFDSDTLFFFIYWSIYIIVIILFLSSRLIDHEEIFQFLKKAHYEGTTCVAA